MLARIASDVYAYSPNILHVLGGANDVGNGRSAALIQADIESICDGAISDGTAKVILGTVYPTSSHQTAPKLAILDTLNDSIRAYATATPGVHLVDYCLAMSSDGNTLNDAGYVIDGVHPSKAGNAVMSRTLAPVLISIATSAA
jgi:lysophospholipase L1-like esterase